MRVRRGLLFWGLLLIPLGAIPLLVRAGQIDPNRLVDAWRLWPLVVIGFGLLVLAGRTRFGLVGLVVIALTIGSIGGAALAGGNLWLGAVGSCGFGGSGGATQGDKTGSLSGAGTGDLERRWRAVDLATMGRAGRGFHAAGRRPEAGDARRGGHERQPVGQRGNDRPVRPARSRAPPRRRGGADVRHEPVVARARPRWDGLEPAHVGRRGDRPVGRGQRGQLQPESGRRLLMGTR